LRYRVEPAFLTRAADAFEAILDGSSVGHLGADLLRRPADRHDFVDFTVLRPVG
jgi:hypothetical protein